METKYVFFLILNVFRIIELVHSWSSYNLRAFERLSYNELLSDCLGKKYVQILNAILTVAIEDCLSNVTFRGEILRRNDDDDDDDDDDENLDQFNVLTIITDNAEDSRRNRNGKGRRRDRDFTDDDDDDDDDDDENDKSKRNRVRYGDSENDKYDDDDKRQNSRDSDDDDHDDGRKRSRGRYNNSDDDDNDDDDYSDSYDDDYFHSYDDDDDYSDSYDDDSYRDRKRTRNNNRNKNRDSNEDKTHRFKNSIDYDAAHHVHTLENGIFYNRKKREAFRPDLTSISDLIRRELVLQEKFLNFECVVRRRVAILKSDDIQELLTDNIRIDKETIKDQLESLDTCRNHVSCLTEIYPASNVFPREYRRFIELGKCEQKQLRLNCIKSDIRNLLPESSIVNGTLQDIFEDLLDKLMEIVTFNGDLQSFDVSLV